MQTYISLLERFVIRINLVKKIGLKFSYSQNISKSLGFIDGAATNIDFEILILILA